MVSKKTSKYYNEDSAVNQIKESRTLLQTGVKKLSALQYRTDTPLNYQLVFSF